MAVKKRTEAADDAADKGKTSVSTGPKETGSGVVTGTNKDIATQAEGRSTSLTAPNEVKNDPGATGNKTIDESRVAAHQEALKARDGEGALSPYSDIPAAGDAAKNDGAGNSDDGKLPIKPRPGSKNDDDGEDDAGDEETGSGEPAPNEGTPDDHVDGAAMGTSYTHGSADFTSSGLPVVGDQYDIDKIADGQEFYAAFLHDPSKSDDHYAVVNILGDLSGGKISRRGVSQNYWTDEYRKNPPRARRDKSNRKGYVVLS